MQDSDAITSLLNYDLWCTDQLAMKMESLSIEDLRHEFPIGWHTLHRTLHPIVTAAELWSDRSRAAPTGIRPDENNPGPEVISASSLRERYRIAGRQMLSSLGELRGTPDSARDVGWHIRRNQLIHITSHSIHHRAQMIFMLTQLGVPDIIEGGDFGGWANGPLKASVDRKTIAQFLY